MAIQAARTGFGWRAYGTRANGAVTSSSDQAAWLGNVLEDHHDGSGMSELIEEILAAEREHSLGIRLLPAADRDRLRERVFSRYGRRSYRVWETLRDCASVQDGEAWTWIGEFVGARSCVLLFDLSEEVEMFHVPSGSSLDQLLQNTFGFEFYVTDLEAGYLICFNHHDFLICCGGAQAWLEQRERPR